jgi:hypothetical protein
MTAALCPAGTVSTNHLEHLESLVQRQLNGRIYEFKLLPRDEGLVLQGFVHTYYAKQLAQATVMNATRCRISANEIEVVAAPSRQTQA